MPFTFQQTCKEPFTFQLTCKELKKAVSLNNAPNVDKLTEFQDPGNLKGKVEYEHKKWIDLHLPPGSKRYDLIFRGCYPIENLTGLNFLKVLCKILNDHQYQPGNFLYLSLDAKPIAALMFALHNVLSITIKIEDYDLKGMYSKLFDASEIQKQQNIEERSQNYLEKNIRDYRERAKPAYYNFFSQTSSEFLSGEVTESFKWALWNSFFGVLVAVANRITRRGNLSIRRSSSSSIDHIPYLACIKFAFDLNESDKVSELLGEVRKKVGEQKGAQTKISHYQARKKSQKTVGEQIEQRKAECMVKTAKHLIIK